IDIAGTAEIGSTVTLYNNGSTVVGMTTADSSGNWQVNSVTLINGTDYSFTATATDAAGSSTPSTPLVFHDNQTAPVITIATIAGDNTVNAVEAATGFAISGSETGADGQTVTVHIVNGSNTVVDSYTATAGSGGWSVNVTPVQAQALADGSYTVKADVSNAAGNPAVEATQPITVAETAPVITIATIAGDNTVNAVEAATGFAISGSETGADGQTVTVHIVNGSNTVVDS